MPKEARILFSQKVSITGTTTINKDPQGVPAFHIFPKTADKALVRKK